MTMFSKIDDMDWPRLHTHLRRLRERKVMYLLRGEPCVVIDRYIAHTERRIAEFNLPPYMKRPRKPEVIHEP